LTPKTKKENNANLQHFFEWSGVCCKVRVYAVVLKKLSQFLGDSWFQECVDVRRVARFFFFPKLPKRKKYTK
jgi:hypothetical protein